MPFIGFPITSQNVKKKSREFPLGGPSCCGETGLAPCRQSTFSSCFFLFFSHFFSICSIKISKSKPQNPRYKTRPPKSHPQKNETVPRKHISFIICLFAAHWISHHVPKRQKKSRGFSLGGPKFQNIPLLLLLGDKLTFRQARQAYPHLSAGLPL